MHTLTNSEARHYLLALANAVDSVDVLMHQLEGTPEGLTVEGATDPIISLREKFKALRVAYGYTPEGLLLRACATTGLPLATAPKGWDMIEAGHEVLPMHALPAMLRPQAA